MQGIATARCTQVGQESLPQVHGYLVAAGNRHERKLVHDDVIFSGGRLKSVVEWDGREFTQLVSIALVEDCCRAHEPSGSCCSILGLIPSQAPRAMGF